MQGCGFYLLAFFTPIVQRYLVEILTARPRISCVRIGEAANEVPPNSQQFYHDTQSRTSASASEFEVDTNTDHIYAGAGFSLVRSSTATPLFDIENRPIH